jgi:hypothetical protein
MDASFCEINGEAVKKADAAKEPIAVGDSAAGTLADAAHKTDRPKSEFELLEISREQYEHTNGLNR